MSYWSSAVLVFHLFAELLQWGSWAQDAPLYNFTPESRHVDINDKESYLIQFQEIVNQTHFSHCYYESDTISGSYEVVKDESSPKKLGLRERRDVSPYPENICGIYVNDVDDTFPRTWTMTACQNGKNYSETVTVSFFYNVALYVDTVAVIPTASYFQYLKTPSGVTWSKCVLSFGDVSIELDITSRKTTVTGNAGDFGKRLTSLGEGRCGFKVTNAAKTDPAKVTFVSTDTEGRVYRTNAQIVVYGEDSDFTNRTVEAHIGDWVYLYCGIQSDSSSSSKQQYCHLYNPKGELVSKEKLCAFKLGIVTVEDIGVWRCKVGYRMIMETLEFTTELVRKASESVELWSRDAESYHTIGCKLVNRLTSNSLDYCKFTAPDGSTYKVTAASATGRFTTLSTDLKNGVCGLEIEKPLLDSDKGTWKCEAYTYSSATGGYAILEKPSVIPYNTQLKRKVHLKDSFSVECSVSYSSSNCHISAPNGTVYQTEDPLRTKLGDCALNVDHASPSDSGNWTCFFARDGGLEDEEITVEVSIVEVTLVYFDTEAATGDEVDLICNTDGTPITSCRFQSPQSRSYYLRKDDDSVSKTPKFAYFGRGLEYGDCGVRISTTNVNDGGYWKCFVESAKTTLSAQLLLKVSRRGIAGVSTGETVGISLGVLAIVAITAVVTTVAVKRRRRRLRRSSRSSDEVVQFSSGETYGSSSSRISIIQSRPHRSYDTSTEVTY